MKILYVVHQFFPLFHTGTERLTLDIAKQIQRMGHYVTVLTYEPSPPLEHSTGKSNNHLSNDDGFITLNENIKKKEYQVQTVPVISFKHTKYRMGFEIFDKYLAKTCTTNIPGSRIACTGHSARPRTWR